MKNPAFLSACVDFRVSNDLCSVGFSYDEFSAEFGVDGYYFCSVAPYENEDGRVDFEVFELHHGAEVSPGGDYLTDGELWQYRVFRSPKVALRFALKCAQSGMLPDKPIRVW